MTEHRGNEVAVEVVTMAIVRTHHRTETGARSVVRIIQMVSARRRMHVVTPVAKEGILPNRNCAGKVRTSEGVVEGPVGRTAVPVVKDIAEVKRIVDKGTKVTKDTADEAIEAIIAFRIKDATEDKDGAYTMLTITLL